jgi:hypothetical protein
MNADERREATFRVIRAGPRPKIATIKKPWPVGFSLRRSGTNHHICRQIP